MDDAQRAGIITEEDIPKDLREALGMTTRARLNTLIHDLIASSYGKSEIRQSEEVAGYLARLREVMFEDVYTNPVAKQEEEKVVLLFGELYHYYESRPEALPEKYRQLIDSGEQEAVVICDYISGMTDQYCIRTFEGIFVPNAWDVL